MRRRLPLVVVVAGVMSLPGAMHPGAALAQTTGIPLAGVQNGRFQMIPTPNGFLRLDTRTGAVSLCAVSGAAAECRAAADDREALMGEVERLAKRAAELESSGVAGPRPAAGPFAGLPSKEDLGKAMDIAEDFMRRMMRLMREETKDRT